MHSFDKHVDKLADPELIIEVLDLVDHQTVAFLNWILHNVDVDGPFTDQLGKCGIKRGRGVVDN